MVVNDQARHTNDGESERSRFIRGLHKAAPRRTKDELFAWTVFDHPRKAIAKGIWPCWSPGEARTSAVTPRRVRVYSV